MEGYKSDRIPVPPAFADIFTHFYVAENHTAGSIHKTLVPSFQTLLVFNFGLPASFSSRQHHVISIEKCLLLGPVKQPIDYTLPAGASILVANFKADAFYRFFGQALTGYPQAHPDPDQLTPDDCFTMLWRELQPYSSASERISHLLRFCQPYIRDRDHTLRDITDLTEKGSPLDPIKTVAGKTGRSERSVQMKHKKYLGYSAREMNRYQRFLKALELVQQLTEKDRKVDWFEIIDQCGYYDQSQLIHDFKYYLHLAPTKYLAFQEDICTSRSAGKYPLPPE